MGTELTSQKQLCRRLRYKQMFYQSEPEPYVPHGRDNSCWCTHSMNVLGPDGEAADPDRCRPGRSCFESL